MRKLVTLLTVAVVLGAASQADAGRISLGTDFDVTIHHVIGASENLTILGLPGSPAFFQPAFRLGYLPGGETHEVYLDAGMLSLSGGGDTQRLTTAMLNYQFNFKSASKTHPYVTAGIGLYNDHVSGGGMTSGLGGAGLGVRHWVAEDHGSIRLEARFDRLGESKIFDFTRIPKSNLVTFKLGFDLWMK